MIPGKFEYHRPQSVDEAVALLADHGDDARVLAGGHSLIPMMKLRLAVPEHLVDLRDIATLRGVSIDGGVITIGAMTTQADVIADDALAAACPLLREAALVIADPQVRYVGTIGGNVANGDPGNDMPAVMQALNATFVLQGPGGNREVAARDYYEAAFFTEANDDEILTSIRIPVPASGHGWAYEKLKRKVGDYATAAAAVIVTLAGGVCRSCSIALTNVGETPLLAEEAAAKLVGSRFEAAAVDAAVEAAKAITDPASDARGPSDYRRYVAGVMVRRALARAVDRANG